MKRLSERLLVVASYVEQGAVVADIGSDHAYLPTYLIKKGIAQKVIAGEVTKGPFDAANTNVKKEGLENNIIVRLADGLFAIEESDCVDTVTIAGMGGSLITTILESGKQRLGHVKRIIAQPNIQAISIREWAVSNDWKLVDEQIILEDDKIYEILVLERGHVVYSELELLAGPFLVNEKNKVFQSKWLSEIVEWNRVLSLITKAEESSSTVEKKEKLTRYIKLIGKELEK